jgi:GAF domain-containing protein
MRVHELRSILAESCERLGALRDAAQSLDRVDVTTELDRILPELRRAVDGSEELGVVHGVLEIVAGRREPEAALAAALAFLREGLHVDASGMRLREGEDYPYFSTVGFEDSFVVAESRLCPSAADGCPVRDADGRVVLECVCGAVIRGRTDPALPCFTDRGSFWTNSTSRLLASDTSEALGATRNRCHAAGYESVALIPLRSGSETFGLVQLNDRRPGAFDPRKVALLEELADVLTGVLV